MSETKEENPTTPTTEQTTNPSENQTPASTPSTPQTTSAATTPKKEGKKKVQWQRTQKVPLTHSNPTTTTTTNAMPQQQMSESLQNKVAEAERIALITTTTPTKRRTTTTTTFSSLLQEKIARLKEIYPSKSTDELFTVLSDYDEDLESAVNFLSGGTKGEKQKQTPQNPNPWTEAVKRNIHRQPNHVAPPVNEDHTRAPQIPKPRQANFSNTPNSNPNSTIVQQISTTAQKTNDDLLTTLGRTLEDQLTLINKKASALLAIQSELHALQNTESEAVIEMKKEKAKLIETMRGLERQLEETRQKIAAIDARIASAESNKTSKIQGIVNLCRDSGLNIIS